MIRPGLLEKGELGKSFFLFFADYAGERRIFDSETEVSDGKLAAVSRTARFIYLVTTLLLFLSAAGAAGSHLNRFARETRREIAVIRPAS
jgi:hypothetical protein